MFSLPKSIQEFLRPTRKLRTFWYCGCGILYKNGCKNGDLNTKQPSTGQVFVKLLSLPFRRDRVYIQLSTTV